MNKNEEFVYDINIWVKENKHINVYRTSELYFKQAFETGYDIAKELDIKLLDATADFSTDWKWIDMNTSFETIIKEYK